MLQSKLEFFIVVYVFRIKKLSNEAYVATALILEQGENIIVSFKYIVSLVQLYDFKVWILNIKTSGFARL